MNELNLKIGKDISLITFDGSVVNSISSPSITAVTHDRKQLGQKAIELLTAKKRSKINNYLAKPKIIEMGFSDNQFLASSLPRTKKPLGFFCSEANLAIDLL